MAGYFGREPRATNMPRIFAPPWIGRLIASSDVERACRVSRMAVLVVAGQNRWTHGTVSRCIEVVRDGSSWPIGSLSARVSCAYSWRLAGSR